jgi:hypothetical protein
MTEKASQIIGIWLCECFRRWKLGKEGCSDGSEFAPVSQWTWVPLCTVYDPRKGMGQLEYKTKPSLLNEAHDRWLCLFPI